MKTKYIAAVFVIAALLTCSAAAARWLGLGGVRIPNAIAAPSGITVTLAGSPMTLNDPAPKMVNSRVVVPVAQFAAGIGGTSAWKADTQEMFVYWRNRYIRMQIGNHNLYYGTFIESDDGVLLTDVQTYALDTRPELVSDVVVGQLSAMVVSLGGEIGWDGESLTANLTLPPSESVVSQVAIETNDTDTAPAFADKSLATLAASVYFRGLSPEEAAEKYEGDEAFILLLYDGAVSADEAIILRNVIQAAKKLALRIYGLDWHDTDDSAYFWSEAIAEDALPVLCVIEGYEKMTFSTAPNYSEAYKVLAAYRALWD